jgi:hypothetical protein
MDTSNSYEVVGQNTKEKLMEFSNDYYEPEGLISPDRLIKP